MKKIKKKKDYEKLTINGYSNGIHRTHNYQKPIPPLRLPRTYSDFYNVSHYQRPTHFNIILEKKPFPVTINRIEFKEDGITQYNYKVEK